MPEIEGARPLISFADEGTSAVVERSLPEPIAYRGRSLIELRLASTDAERREVFTDLAFEVPNEPDPPPAGRPVIAGDVALVYEALGGSGGGGAIPLPLPDPPLPDAPSGSGDGGVMHSPGPRSSETVVAERYRGLAADAVAAGQRLVFYRDLLGNAGYRRVPKLGPPLPRIYLIEEYQLSSHLGKYGAGRVVKTFSLLPGERTKISVRSFLKTEQERKKASSVLDSVTSESARDFESSIEAEQSNKSEYQQAFELTANAEAKAKWGWGSASARVGVKASTNAAREEASKNVSKAVEKHTAKASAQRDVEINTSFEVKQTTEDETSIEREIENINVSRTLNFVFRQMNQQFYSVLHLIDARIAFSNGHPSMTYEVPIHGLDALLERYVKEPSHATARGAIENALGAILDHAGDPHRDFLNTRTIDGESYQRINRAKVSTYEDPLDPSATVTVEGIITAVTKNVMRTEGVIVEALLGEVSALDEYARDLQELEVKRREAEVRALLAEAVHKELVASIVDSKDEERAAILARLTCACGAVPRHAGGNAPEEES